MRQDWIKKILKFSLEKAAGFDLYPMDCWRCLLLRHPQKAAEKRELIYARQLSNIKVISLKWSANLVGNIYKFKVLKQWETLSEMLWVGLEVFLSKQLRLSFWPSEACKQVNCWIQWFFAPHFLEKIVTVVQVRKEIPQLQKQGICPTRRGCYYFLIQVAPSNLITSRVPCYNRHK